MIPVCQAKSMSIWTRSFRRPEVLAVLHGEPRRMGRKRLQPSFETPRKMRGSSG
jgi:hypothetical protein